jgi:hypothetical protein
MLSSKLGRAICRGAACCTHLGQGKPCPYNGSSTAFAEQMLLRYQFACCCALPFVIPEGEQRLFHKRLLIIGNPYICKLISICRPIKYIYCWIPDYNLGDDGK